MNIIYCICIVENLCWLHCSTDNIKMLLTKIRQSIISNESNVFMRLSQVNKHETISSKATKTLGFLRRNLAFAPRSTKEVAYKTLVQPKLEYAAPIWSPHSKLQINQIVKVQRTAARWTCRRWPNTSSVSEMLDEPERTSLEAQRDLSSLLLLYKIHCGAVSIEKDKYMTPAHSLKTTRS